MKKKYGEITMLDMPQFTKATFPGVTRMDLFSGLFGDVTDESMYVAPGTTGRGRYKLFKRAKSVRAITARINTINICAHRVIHSYVTLIIHLNPKHFRDLAPWLKTYFYQYPADI